jgi:NAD(P)-dependent dehydrogenase (short-subunit alcohol dehydrogenase family)
VDYGLASRVVVSGGTSGIGLAAAAAAARDGAHVAVICTSEEHMARALAQLRDAPGGQSGRRPQPARPLLLNLV